MGGTGGAQRLCRPAGLLRPGSGSWREGAGSLRCEGVPAVSPGFCRDGEAAGAAAGVVPRGCWPLKGVQRAVLLWWVRGCSEEPSEADPIAPPVAVCALL